MSKTREEVERELAEEYFLTIHKRERDGKIFMRFDESQIGQIIGRMFEALVTERMKREEGQ